MVQEWVVSLVDSRYLINSTDKYSRRKHAKVKDNQHDDMDEEQLADIRAALKAREDAMAEESE